MKRCVPDDQRATEKVDFNLTTVTQSRTIFEITDHDAKTWR
jgi:hypothetical protein